MIGPGREQPHPYIRTEERAGNKEPVVTQRLRVGGTRKNG